MNSMIRPRHSLFALLLAIFLLATAHAAPGTGVSQPEMPVLHEVFIPLPDGTRLAADLFTPAGLSLGGEGGERLPVLLEYLPYRKTEGRSRSADLYHYFTSRGYVVARVDIRGTGASEGRLIPHEYSAIELDDGEQVIAWLAAQPWSNGKVGMFGISWGGFNAIQMAVRAPPALNAFVAVMATEDLYQDDVHYMDGILHMDSWMMSHDLYNALPGAPDYVLDEAWQRDRFDTEPSIFTYLRQQRDGPFWDRASARDKYDQIKVPGFHIGGWYDGYRDSVARMVENVSVPVKGLVGPWDHFWPHDAWPGESIEWRAEAVRWFDHWLKGEDTGMLEEPKLAVFMRDWHPPSADIETVPGHWRWLDSWPPAGQQIKTLYAQAGGLLATAPAAAGQAPAALPYKASIGVEAGGPVMWWGSVAPDQQGTDDHSLVFETEPLAEPLQIVGLPRALLQVSADAVRGNWIARLSNVAPDGQVTQVAGAAFNGTHRKSAREPSALLPGEWFDLDIEMRFTSWTFPAGHRIRLAVNNAQWPMLWPTPYPMTTQLKLGGAGGARVLLPLAPPPGKETPQFASPAPAPVMAGFHTLDAGNVTGYGEIREVQVDPETGEAVALAANSGGQAYPWGTERFEEKIEFRTLDSDPARSSMHGTYAIEVALPERLLRFEASIKLRSDRDNFYLDFTRRQLLDGQLQREKHWQESIPRDYQ
jgi:putative CocE/NonD family hydrolase